MTYTRDEALALGHPTVVLGPSQVSVQQTNGASLYVLNWITDEGARGQGHGGAVFKALLGIADAADTTLVTHPDTPELQSQMEKYGFKETSGPVWAGKPFMIRTPVSPSPYAPYPLGAELVNF